MVWTQQTKLLTDSALFPEGVALARFSTASLCQALSDRRYRPSSCARGEEDMLTRLDPARTYDRRL